MQVRRTSDVTASRSGFNMHRLCEEGTGLGIESLDYHHHYKLYASINATNPKAKTRAERTNSRAVPASEVDVLCNPEEGAAVDTLDDTPVGLCSALPLLSLIDELSVVMGSTLLAPRPLHM